ncbi:uncharacterized protein LOC110863415 isoform X4 [Folsomia candida]|nr:uncharacterized protein LOC110863415 isoform X4 [Folsomia candida]XP_021968411.1 uncharacterized protein LOC110863415 isoform X4 [Folsomia candida]XP_021968412.1 uncharacterized protein LOC110863415 isoform X4 [Folsomia candida]XP_021968413.1 uncharacterized protein LOC110863415 isoform X4 [Folsomia candida]XP_035712850.1 uncharacterized protein LOC110863415 isoform X4 [Folsomia candida]
MSHTVTVTRTTTTTTTSAILLNIGYFKTIPGILKLLHIVLGIVCVSLVGHYIAYHKIHQATRGPSFSHIPDHGLFIPELFFLLIATTCLIASTLLLISCLISIATATILPKTVFEIVYHVAAMILLLLSAIIYIVKIEGEYTYKSDAYKYKSDAFKYTPEAYKARLSAGIIGIINSILYGVAVFFAYRNFKSG